MCDQLNPGSAEWGAIYQNRLGREVIYNMADSFSKIMMFC